MNSMLKNQNNNLGPQFLKFYKEFQQSGKDPQKALQELIDSGKVSKDQLEQTVNKAKGLSFLLNLIK